MGKELEYKLHIPDEDTLLRILHDPSLMEMAEGSMKNTAMKTTYYDTEDNAFQKRNWTFRHRLEGETNVVCLKTPTKESHTRGEFQVEASSLCPEAVAALIEQGAPVALAQLYHPDIMIPICGAEFIRHSRMLKLPSGGHVELAGDHGILHGRLETCSFIELELELYDGNPTEMLALVHILMQRYGLKEQPLSKFARARMLK